MNGLYGVTTSLTNASSLTGQKVAESRYLPYGQIRWRSTGPTDFGFTDPGGQMPPGVLGAPLIALPGYTPSPLVGPGYAPVPPTQFGAGYLSLATTSGRSANTAGWATYSAPSASRARASGPGRAASAISCLAWASRP